MNMIIGGLLFVVGVAVTIGSLAARGDVIVIAYGAIVVGAAQFLIGLFQASKGQAVGEGGLKRRLLLLAPFAVAMIVLVGIFVAPLSWEEERPIESAMIGQSVPDFDLPPGLPGRAGLASASLRRGEPHVVNIFASWCIPCRIEAPQLDMLKRRGIPIDGIAVRDRPQDLAQFLAAYGDPFRTIGADTDRRVQIALGSAGVPETFVIDGRGIIRHQHIGPIMDADLAEIVAAYEAARR
ncbi:MAG TPA: redoxin domain-containing protein [Allosphingosinicella sp.]|nr:redoxin domain-containing protein [Allosphingosinicella sp.]